jgi:hypothetical protein
MAALERLHEQYKQSEEQNAAQLTSADITDDVADGLAAGSDLKEELRAELLKASGAGKVGSQVNNHLGHLTSATLNKHPEIAAILEEHGFRQGQYADQFFSQLTTEDMSALASKLLLADHAAAAVYPNMIIGVHGNDATSPGQDNSEHEHELRGNISFAICFAKAGSLGLKFTPVQGQAHVYEIIPGTKADQHMQFRPGLMLTAVAGRDVAGLAYTETTPVVLNLHI